jgi:stage III sporulation protein SpoIIIAA
MVLIKIDRDLILEKVYECRGKIEVTNKDALEIIDKLMDLIIHAPESENKSNYPTIRVRRN